MCSDTRVGNSCLAEVVERIFGVVDEDKAGVGARG